jgi:hypothetical protein
MGKFVGKSVARATQSLALSAKSEEAEDAGVKAYVNTPNPEDAGIRRFAALSASDGTRTRDLRRDRPAF